VIGQKSPAPRNPFVREGHVDKPGIVGSHWWNEELAKATALRSRRNVILGLVAAGGAIAALGAGAFAVAAYAPREELRRSLDVQRDYGWAFGATSETVAFDLHYTTAYAREALPRLAQDLKPSNGSLLPWFVPSLFQSPEALPRQRVPPEETPTALANVLRPIHTPTMTAAEGGGAALAELLSAATGGRIAVILDLDGPESMAAAAGMADDFDPVFLFDNWPHPRGVVTAHLTLAAAVYYQPRFAAAASSRKGGAPPVFVLDRRRLAAYTDDAEQFDNRWLCKLPSSADLKALEIKRALYVVATSATPIDLRDTAAHMEEWARAGIDVRAVALGAFVPSADGKVRFGGSAEAHEGFFGHYRWRSAADAPVLVPSNDGAAQWRPQPPVAEPSDKTLGMVRVDVDRDTGLVVAPHSLRSGSYNRASGGWGG
jgi:hypothetical protein